MTTHRCPNLPHLTRWLLCVSLALTALVAGTGRAFADDPNFGSVCVGQSSPDHEFFRSGLRCGSFGAPYDGIVYASISGDADFQIVANSCGSPLSPFSSCEFDIRFTPTAVGPRSAVLTVERTCGDFPDTQMITLAGVGLAPGPPVFGTLSNLSATTDPGKCTASVSFSPTVQSCGTPTVVCKVGDNTITSPHDFPVGTTTVNCTAADASGNTATASFTVTVTDAEEPTFTNCPPADPTAIATCQPGGGIGAVVNYPALAASDNCSVPTISYDAGHAPGASFPLGDTRVTATDAAGKSATCPFTVTVACAWSGMLQPVNADGTSVFKLGSVVPVKFALTQGSACITTLQATFSATKLSSSVVGPVNKTGSTSGATNGSLFRYDPKSGQYVFNWGTKGLTAGTYRLQINLGDGVIRTVNVGLK